MNIKTFLKRAMPGLVTTLALSVFTAAVLAGNAFAKGNNDSITNGQNVYSALASVESRSGDAYYNYMLAQFSISNGDIEGAIDYYDRALAHDPDSTILNAEIAHLYVRRRENTRAIRHLEKALKIDPEYHKGLILLGELYASSKLSFKAIEVLERSIKIKPENQRGYLALATVYLNRGDHDNAIATFNRYLEIKPDSVLSYYYLGRIEAERENLGKARDHYKKALEINPGFSAVYTELAQIYEAEGEFDKAVEIYDNILRISPNDIQSRQRIGQIRIQQSRLKEALPYFKWIADYADENIGAMIKTGLINFELEQYSDAAQWFRKALDVEPEADKVRYYLSTTLEELGDFKAAAEEFNKVSESDSTFIDSKIHLAYIYDRQKNFDKAIEVLDEAISLKGVDPALFRLKISIYREAGRAEEAYKLTEDAAKLFPEDIDLHYTLGVLCDELESSLACLDHMFKVVEMDPSYASALNYIGYTYIEKGMNLNEAEKYIKQALQSAPESAHIIDSLGWLYYTRGELDKAVIELEKAYKALPNDPIVAEHLADAYLKSSLRKKAIALYKKVITLDPENVKVGDKIQKLLKELDD